MKLYFWVHSHKQTSMCLTLEQNGILKKGTSRRNPSMPWGSFLFFLPCLPFPPFLPGNHKVKEVYGPSSSITHPHAMTCTEWDLWNFPHKTTAFNFSVSNYIIDRENLQRNNWVPSLSCLRSISRGSAESHLLCLFPKTLGCCPIRLLGCECLGQRRRNSK